MGKLLRQEKIYVTGAAICAFAILLSMYFIFFFLDKTFPLEYGGTPFPIFTLFIIIAWALASGVVWILLKGKWKEIFIVQVFTLMYLILLLILVFVFGPRVPCI